MTYLVLYQFVDNPDPIVTRYPSRDEALTRLRFLQQQSMLYAVRIQPTILEVDDQGGCSLSKHQEPATAPNAPGG